MHSGLPTIIMSWKALSLQRSRLLMTVLIIFCVHTQSSIAASKEETQATMLLAAGKKHNKHLQQSHATLCAFLCLRRGCDHLAIGLSNSPQQGLSFVNTM